MKLKSWSLFLACGASAFAVMCVTASPALGDDATPDSLSIEMTLATGDTFSQGEPIMLHYKISNSSDDDLLTYMSTDKGWLSERLVDASGQTIPLTSNILPAQEYQSHSTGPVVQAHSWQQGDIVASQHLVIPRPGLYILSLHLSIPYDTPRLLIGEIRSDKFKGEISQDFKFSLTVTPTAPARLRTLAEAYRHRACDEKADAWSPSFVEALFSIPESQALTSWREIASDSSVSSLVRAYVIQGLLRAHSEATADIMADMIWNPAQDSGTVAMAPANKLADMFMIGGSSLKAHIKQIYASHGLVMPDKPVVARGID